MNILIINDFKPISLIIRKTLTSYGYIAHTATSNEPIKPIIKNKVYDMVILNTILDFKNSIDICVHIRRKFPKTYIIGINNQGSLDTKIEFLNSGADDCLSYPFPTQELLARIQALLRRPRISVQPKIKYGNITLIPSSRKAYYYKSPLSLTKKEFHLLNYFIINKERTITRYELLDHIWDYKRITSSNTVDVHIQRLRKKLLDCKDSSNHNNSNPSLHKETYSKSYSNFFQKTIIQTIHGIGYKLEKIPNQRYMSQTETLPEIK